MNGFGTRSSDMDICLITKHDVGDEVSFLAQVRRLLKRKCGSFLNNDIELIPAKVPILKMYDDIGQIEIDLSCANGQAVRNSHLLFCYSQLDWRVRPLVINIKTWAKNAGINDAKYSTISSYTLTLMIIHFLQHGTRPNILPSLSQLHPQMFHGNSNIFKLNFFNDLPKFASRNEQSLGELLVGFFRYYNQDFNFMVDCGSVRCGKAISINECYNLSKQQRTNPGQWNAYICMEEPFDRSNSGRAIIKRPQFDKILSSFQRAQRLMENTKCIQCLFGGCEKH